MDSDHASLVTAVEILAQEKRLRLRFVLTIVALICFFLIIATIGISIGAVNISFRDVWTVIGLHIVQRQADAASMGSIDIIIWEIRTPRVVIGALVGAGLAVLGVAIQAMVRNPLADPYVLGVESGAAAGAVAVIFFGGVLGQSLFSPTLGAFGGAILTLILVFALARQGGRISSTRLLLVGVALSFALSGITTFMQYATHDPSTQEAILFWLVGGLGGAEWSQVPLMASVLAVGTLIIWYFARQLDALAMGDESAASLGMTPDRLRSVLFVILSLVVAVVVSIVGPIGFIGLVIPHIARLLVGAAHRRVITIALLLGGSYLVGVDVLGRWLVAPNEIPVGVLTAILGTPFFIWLIRYRNAMAR